MKVIAISSVLFAVAIWFLVIYTSYVPDFKVGQKWEKCYYKDNPFKPTDCDTFLILGVKDNYIQYQNIEIGWIDSEKDKWFYNRNNTKLLK